MLSFQMTLPVLLQQMATYVSQEAHVMKCLQIPSNARENVSPISNSVRCLFSLDLTYGDV